MYWSNAAQPSAGWYNIIQGDLSVQTTERFIIVLWVLTSHSKGGEEGGIAMTTALVMGGGGCYATVIVVFFWARTLQMSPVASSILCMKSIPVHLTHKPSQSKRVMFSFISVTQAEAICFPYRESAHLQRKTCHVFFSWRLRQWLLSETMTKIRLKSRKDDLFIVKVYQEEAFVQLVEWLLLSSRTIWRKDKLDRSTSNPLLVGPHPGSGHVGLHLIGVNPNPIQLFFIKMCDLLKYECISIGSDQ